MNLDTAKAGLLLAILWTVAPCFPPLVWVGLLTLTAGQAWLRSLRRGQ